MSGTPARRRQWSRPSLASGGPQRSFAALNRTSEGTLPGLGGIPLTNAEDAVVAAVRLAYKVADTQIARSATLAKRLRTAGDQAVGAQSDLKALDATEQLVLRAFMTVLSWIEGLAPGAAAESPLKRLLSAEFRMVGSMLGLNEAPASRHGSHKAQEAPPAPPRENARPEAQIFLVGESKRPVVVKRLVLTGGPLKDVILTFYHSVTIDCPPMSGTLSSDGIGQDELRVTTRRSAPSGLWKAAVCEGDMQVGLVEIEL